VEFEFKKGDWVVYKQPPRVRGSAKLVVRVTRTGAGFVWVDWLGQGFPIIGWDEEQLEPASVVDVLAAVTRTA